MYTNPKGLPRMRRRSDTRFSLDTALLEFAVRRALLKLKHLLPVKLWSTVCHDHEHEVGVDSDEMRTTTSKSISSRNRSGSHAA